MDSNPVPLDRLPGGKHAGINKEVGERRTTRRIRTVKAARLILDCAEVDCLIRDISARGTRVKLALHINAETAEQLVMREERSELPVRFVWQRGDEVGLAFD